MKRKNRCSNGKILAELDLKIISRLSLSLSLSLSVLPELRVNNA